MRITKYVIFVILVSTLGNFLYNFYTRDENHLYSHKDLRYLEIQKLSDVELEKSWTESLNDNRIVYSEMIQDVLISRGHEGAITDRAYSNYIIAMRAAGDMELQDNYLKECISLLRSIKSNKFSLYKDLNDKCRRELDKLEL